ncbi:MAG: amino acid adenylation domain-containing protein [Verrucomicrobiales bacterium]
MAIEIKPDLGRDLILPENRRNNFARDEWTMVDLLLAHYRIQEGVFISKTEKDEHGVHASSTLTAAPMWNHSAWDQGDSANFDAWFKTAQNRNTGAHRRPVVYVPMTVGQAVPTELGAQGYEKFDEEVWMTYEGDPAPAALRPGLLFKEVTTSADLELFIELFFESYNIKASGYAEALRENFKNRLPTTHQHFVLWNNDVPVSIATLAVDGIYGCIYNVGTPPKARKKGYAEQLLRQLLMVSKQANLKLFLQVEANSGAHQLYQKIGFQEAFTRHGFRLKNWQAPAQLTERSGLTQLLGSFGEETSTLTHGRESKTLEPRLVQKLGAFLNQNKLGFEAFITGAVCALIHRYHGEDEISIHLQAKGKSPIPIQAIIPSDSSMVAFLLDLEQGGTTINSSNQVSSAPAPIKDVLLKFGLENSFAAESEYPIEISFDPETRSRFEIHYQQGLFKKDTMRRLGSHLVCLIESLLEKSEGTIGDLNLLSDRERHQLLVEWNQTPPLRQNVSIQQLFEEQVEKRPEALALMLAPGSVPGASQQMTYRQLNRKANRLAHRLQMKGVGPDVMVGICLERSLEMIISLLAVFKAGGTSVSLDPSYPVERIQYMLEDTKAPIVITHSKFKDSLLASNRGKVICLDTEWESIATESEKNPSHPAQGDNAAYVIYTSGSTGKPKGVVISNAAIANHSVDCQIGYGLSHADKVLQFSSFNFDASLEQILPALISGATLVLRDDEVWTTTQFSEKLNSLGLTVADIPTAYWHQLAEEWHTNPSAIPRNSLRLVIVGGEAVNPEKLQLWRATSMNKVRFVNAYGPTETTITATAYEISGSEENEFIGKTVPIGKPRGSRKIYILDRYGNPAPIGIPGELHIGGGLLAKGYLNRPDLTEAKFIPNPFSDVAEDRLYKTGDLSRYLEDGNIEFLGRLDDQVKIRGFRIELGEIESTLNQHSDVKDSIVLARANESGDKRLVAYVIPALATLDPRRLKAFLKTKLPEYMTPSTFVALPEWPLMPNGKVDRKALPAPSETTDENEQVNGPRDPLELQLQLIFERVLRRVPIGIDVSFFELGGDSLQALELLVEIERATGKNLPMGTLYQTSTIEGIASELKNRSGAAEWSSLVPMQKSGNCPPLYFIHTTPGDILGYGNLVYRLGTDQPCYGFQSLGLKSSELAHLSIEEMAQYYVGLLREFQPNGPYYLSGWCYGGVLAVEMARLLMASGEKIGLLALLETVGMPPSLSNFKYYLHRLRCSAKMHPSRLAIYLREKMKYVRDAQMANRMRFKQVDRDGKVKPDQERDPRLAQLEHVYNTNLEALSRFKSSYYPGKVTLFNAAERDPALIPDPQYGWVGLASEIEVHLVPGNHDTMLTEPNVSVLAQKLDKCLKRAHQC